MGCECWSFLCQLGKLRLRQGLVGTSPYLSGDIQTEEQLPQSCTGDGHGGKRQDFSYPQGASVGFRASALALG